MKYQNSPDNVLYIVPDNFTGNVEEGIPVNIFQFTLDDIDLINKEVQLRLTTEYIKRNGTPNEDTKRRIVIDVVNRFVKLKIMGENKL